MMQQLGRNSALSQRSVVGKPIRARAQASRTVGPQALFTKKREAKTPVEAPVVEQKKGLFGRRTVVKTVEAPVVEQKKGFFGRAAPKAAMVEKAPIVEKKSLFGRAAPKAAVEKTATKNNKAAEYEKKKGAFGRTMSAFDFAEVRSKSDAELLYAAKYEKLEGGKMTKEQYAALRRKVGGTSKDFFKTQIDVVGKYTDKGYVGESSVTTVPGLPFLAATIVGLFGALFYVVSQTS